MVCGGWSAHEARERKVEHLRAGREGAVEERKVKRCVEATMKLPEYTRRGKGKGRDVGDGERKGGLVGQIWVS